MTLDINYTTTNPRKVDQLLEDAVDKAGSISSSGVPFVVPSSGSVINVSGGISTITAFDYIIGASYSFFPLSALYLNSSPGWYYTVWDSTSGGVVYGNMYTAGEVNLPIVPTPISSTLSGYVQLTGADIAGPTYSVLARELGNNGGIEWNRVVNNNSNSNNKTYNLYFGGNWFHGYTQTTNRYSAGQGTLKNRGVADKQISVSANYGDNNNASSLPKLTVNTTIMQTVSFSIQLAVATDYAIIESHFLRKYYTE